MEQREEMLEAGMDDFIRKPYRAQEIYACLERHLGAKFIYEGIADAKGTAQPLTPAMLSRLPEALRGELRTVLESLESEAIAKVIAQVADHDPSLQKTLTQLADNFDYPAILKALDR